MSLVDLVDNADGLATRLTSQSEVLTYGVVRLIISPRKKVCESRNSDSFTHLHWGTHRIAATAHNSQPPLLPVLESELALLPPSDSYTSP